MNEMKSVKCKNCGKRLFDIEAVGKIETKCPKCGKIVTVDISVGRENLGNVDYLKLIRKFYKTNRFRLADSEKTFNPDKHDGLIYSKYKCLCLRSERLEKMLLKVLPDVSMKNVISFLMAKNALKHDKDKNTVKISTLSKSVESKRFYALWLSVLE